MESRVAAANIAQVAFEVLDVDCVESDDGRVETNVCFCDAITVVVRTWALGEMVFGSVQGFEKLGYGLLVGFLSTVIWSVSNAR